jgi:hypothetical protein
VGKHGAKGHVTNAADVRDLGSVLGVDDDAAALVQLEANVLQAQALSVGTAADGDQDNLGINLLTRISTQP